MSRLLVRAAVTVMAGSTAISQVPVPTVSEGIPYSAIAARVRLRRVRPVSQPGQSALAVTGYPPANRLPGNREPLSHSIAGVSHIK